VKPVEQALVDDRSPNGLPKKPSCDEAGSSTEQSAHPSYPKKKMRNGKRKTLWVYLRNGGVSSGGERKT
jgi:hypothetical protein